MKSVTGPPNGRRPCHPCHDPPPRNDTSQPNHERNLSLLIGVCTVAMIGLVASEVPRTVTAWPPAAAPETYRVTALGAPDDHRAHVAIQWSNRSGDMERESARALPAWTKEYTMQRGGFVTLSIINSESPVVGGVTCQIFVNGETLQRQRATGRGGVATCSGIVGQ